MSDLSKNRSGTLSRVCEADDVGQLVEDDPSHVMLSRPIGPMPLPAGGPIRPRFSSSTILRGCRRASSTAPIVTYGHLFPDVRERIRVAPEDTWDEGHCSAG